MKTGFKWVFYQDSKKEWRWKVFAKNGTQVGASSEGYSSKQKRRGKRTFETIFEVPKRSIRP